MARQLSKEIEIDLQNAGFEVVDPTVGRQRTVNGKAGSRVINIPIHIPPPEANKKPLTVADAIEVRRRFRESHADIRHFPQINPIPI